MDLTLTPLTFVFLTLGVIAVAATFIVVASRIGALPERIPTHFGFTGHADAWGKRKMIWLAPWISLGMFVAVLLAGWTSSRGPRADGALVPKMLEGVAAMGACIALTMLLSTWRWLTIAAGQGKRLGWFVLAVIFLLPLIVLFVYRKPLGL